MTWVSYLGQGVRHLIVDGRFACGRKRRGNVRRRNKEWNTDYEGLACQSCVREQMKMAKV
ncbi:hypothetical protein LCGC14_1167710 [marine sediment metagenome]|uniref:Uncharacterized protein n=1 Tax=marine sediment metagenome TaxID=412755 RepID=A0A0F9MDR2_9ZZZZ